MDVKNFLNSSIIKAVFSKPLPKSCQYILVNQTPEEFKENIRKYLSENKKPSDDPDFPGCPEGCECPSDKGCGIV
jgi:hypothetical protein